VNKFLIIADITISYNIDKPFSYTAKFTNKSKQRSAFNHTDKSKLIGIESKKIFLSDYIK